MVFTALDTEPSSPSPPDGANAPSSCDAGAEPIASEAHEAATSPSRDTPHAKAPAASLISIAVKHKPAGPSKAGDLTRFFELAHRQAPTAPPSDAAPVEVPPTAGAVVESPPATESEAATHSIESAVAAAPTPAAAPLEFTPEPLSTEPTVATDPTADPEVGLEVSFPLLLAPPPAAIDDPAIPAPAEAAPVPVADATDGALLDWSEAAAASEPVISAESIEPLNVSFVPMEDTPAVAERHEPPRAETQPGPVWTAAIAEPATPAIEPPPIPETAPPPVAAAAVDPALVEPVPAPVRIAPPAPVFKELADYWRSQRNGADHPAAESIDRDLVTERWPGTLLIAYTPPSQDPRGELRPGRVTRLGTACAETQNVVDAGSHSTEWMLEVAHTALVNDEPVEEQQRLATLTGVAGFRMVALPLGSPKGLANAVLCTLLPCPAAPRFGKRRIWL